MVEIPNFLEKLDDKIVVLGISNILYESQIKSGLSTKESARLFGLIEKTYKKYLISKNRASIKFLKTFCEKIDSEVFDKIYALQKLEFTARQKKVFLPKIVTPDLAYFVGYLQGDGFISSDKKQIGFSDEYFDQAEKIELLSRNLFGLAGHVFPKKSPLSGKDSACLEIKSVVLNSFLHNVFDINRGEKQNLKIPNLIKQDKILLKYYLAGLFDSDGTLPINPAEVRQLFIDITFKDKSFIEEIKGALLVFGVETQKIYERIGKSPKDGRLCSSFELRNRQKGMLLKFLQEIGFYHTNKALRAKLLYSLLDR